MENKPYYDKHPQRGKCTPEAIASIPEYECEQDKPATKEEQQIIDNILYLKKFKGQEESILGQLRYSNRQAVEKEMAALREWTSRQNHWNSPSEGYAALNKVREYIDTRWPKAKEK
jgi:hypothetical protein